MAIQMRQLECKEYNGKVCTGFKYNHRNEQNELLWTAQYTRANEQQWRIVVVLDKTPESSHQVYQIDYIMPKASMSLEMVAGVGLKYLQLRLKEEVQSKIEMDFDIGELTKDLVG